MRKIFIIILLIFNAVDSYCQSQKDMEDKMIELANKGNDEEAKAIALNLINLKFGTINNETNFYAQYVISDYYYSKRKYKIGLHYFNDLLEFTQKNELSIENKKQLLKDIKTKIQDLKDFLPDDSTSDESVLAEIKKNSNADINTTQTTISNKTSETNPVNEITVSDNSNSQPDKKETNTDKTVTLTVSGTGKTIDEAKTDALRSAIEQAFGAFISSKTEILNDNLVKDEIVSVSNGNIQKFEIISEVQIPNGDYTTSLKATVSVTKLTSFVESKGVAVEFKGSLFAFNVNQQILNEKNEIKAIEDLCNTITKLSDASFEYSIKVSEPVALNASNEKWRIPIYISVSANNNLLSIATYINQTLKGLSLSIDEANNYIRLGKNVYPISIAANKKEYNYILLRTEKGVSNLISQLYYFNHSIQNFYIENGIDKFRVLERKQNDLKINDENFRPFVLKVGQCMAREMYSKGSVFYNALGSNGYQKITMELNPILEWREWAKVSRQWRGCGYGWSEFYMGYDYIQYSTIFPHDNFFNENFVFVKNLSGSILNGQSGLIIDFSDISINKEIVGITLYDLRSLDEINKISEYKVSPLGKYKLLN